MTFAGRIRLFFVAIALTPPVVIMAVTYFYLVRQAENADRQAAIENVQRYQFYVEAYENDIALDVQRAAESDYIRQFRLRLRGGQSASLEIAPGVFGLDFLEIVEKKGKVVASSHRPGLVGESLTQLQGSSGSGLRMSVEYDLNGAHAAFCFLRPLDSLYSAYGGRYINQEFMIQMGQLLAADLAITFNDSAMMIESRMTPGVLYDIDGKYRALLAGGPQEQFYLLADFWSSGQRPLFVSLLQVTGIVGAFSVAVAILAGLFITSRAKREIDNLMTATSRIAEGDFSTPVMAYEEGEFARLADSFSEMTLQLRRTRQRLAMSEKIAAWETIGRKLAHEVKNPLSPIAICADDLRSSYKQKLPDFEKLLFEATTMIKDEVRRLSDLLDQFVSFARMKPPDKQTIPPAQLIDGIASIYNSEISANRLKMTCESNRPGIHLDPDSIRQVLINLVKNSLETDPDTTANVLLHDIDDALEIRIEDTGPGFNGERLANPFEPSLSTKRDGSGLGLVICQRIIHDHDGSIELYNRADGGAGVVIRLPIS
ncbi:MAG: PAS domain-containing sensor histidine kinase [Candidatus Zixiibacteriota bacterium]